MESECIIFRDVAKRFVDTSRDSILFGTNQDFYMWDKTQWTERRINRSERINIAIQRGNPASLLRPFPVDSDADESF